jgi:hypothetical protein
VDLSRKSGLLVKTVTPLPPPSPEAQVTFLQRLQRIAEEGDFTATYKFALLIALAELAVERGSDDGAALALKTSWIAEKFVELYWQQTLPYSAGETRQSGVLSQLRADKGAAVATYIAHFRVTTGASTLTEARGRGTAWNALVREVAKVVRAQPVRFLQNVGGETTPFLYELQMKPGAVTLSPGVAFCLRCFLQGFVLQLARAGWVRHVRENPRNRAVLGDASDLEAFLFGRPRSALLQAREFLRKLQSRTCFYCSGSLHHASSSGGSVA